MKTEKKVKVLVAESCPTLQSHGEAHQGPLRGILQERILEWVAFPYSGGSSRPRALIGSPSCGQILYCLSHGEAVNESWDFCY